MKITLLRVLHVKLSRTFKESLSHIIPAIYSVLPLFQLIGTVELNGILRRFSPTFGATELMIFSSPIYVISSLNR